jgi:hypothetical protein
MASKPPFLELANATEESASLPTAEPRCEDIVEGEID